MKVVCLVDGSAPTLYFTNKVNEKIPLSLVVIHDNSHLKTSKNRKRRFKTMLTEYGILVTLKFILRFLKSQFKNTTDPENYEKYFDKEDIDLDEKIPAIYKNINSESTYKTLKEINPDLIVIHGGPIVKDEILTTAKLALNLHWGLSPYYRGSNCTQWALINWDPYNIGVTIHKATKDIDGGEILAQKRAKITEEDNITSINTQLTKLGTQLVLNIIEKIERNENLKFRHQDFGLGYMTYMRQWSMHLDDQIIYIEQHKLIAKALKYPSRKGTLPIVEIEMLSAAEQFS